MSGRMINMPLGFISHGAPTVALTPNSDYARALANWARQLPRPEALVVVSAHWEAPGPVRDTSGLNPPVIHDFGGFPEPPSTTGLISLTTGSARVWENMTPDP